MIFIQEPPPPPTSGNSSLDSYLFELPTPLPFPSSCDFQSLLHVGCVCVCVGGGGGGVEDVDFLELRCTGVYTRFGQKFVVSK